MLYLTPKCTKFNFDWGSSSDLIGELTASLRPPFWIQEILLSREMGRMKEKEGKGKERKGQ